MAMTQVGLLRGRRALREAVRLPGRTSQLWLGGGALGVIVVLALGWFLLIRPTNAEAGRLADRVATAHDTVESLRQRLAEVRTQNRQLDRYRTELAKARAALPTTVALSTFLRDVQGAGVRSGVEVRGLIVGAPTQVTKASGLIYSLQVTLTAAGTAAKLDVFLTQLQRVQPRAVLISTATATPEGDSKTLSGSALLTLGMLVFVAPAVAGGTADASTVPGPTASSTN